MITELTLKKGTVIDMWSPIEQVILDLLLKKNAVDKKDTAEQEPDLYIVNQDVELSIII